MSDVMSAVMSAADTAFVLGSAPWIFLMQLGFAMLEAGTVREHNVIATYTKNVIDLVLAMWLSACFGFAVARGLDLDNPHPLTWTAGDQHAAHFFHHVAFQGTAATIISGAMAERTTILAYGILSSVVSGPLYCLAVRWTWGGGWLGDRGFHDFAGSGVVHLLGGSAALVGAVTLGAREGRWDPVLAGSFVPHNIPSVLSGTLMLFVGWLSFNAGSAGAMSTDADAATAEMAAMATTVSGCASASASLAIGLARSRGHRINVLGMANAMLIGLVSITAGCDVIDPAPAAATGEDNAAGQHRRPPPGLRFLALRSQAACVCAQRRPAPPWKFW